MSRRKNEDNSFIASVIGNLIGFVVAGVMLVLGFFLRLAFSWARQPIIDGMRLDDLSVGWRKWKWLYNLIGWSSFATYAILVLAALAHFLATPHSAGHALSGVMFLVIGLACGLPFLTICWIEQLHGDPDTQRQAAGRRAEQRVAKLIDSCIGSGSPTQALHSALFVFNRGQDNEYSAEVDHLVITSKRIYLIETKYKSGTIWASANAQDWKTSFGRGEGTMRNALDQAKNSCRVLQQEMNLPPIIPIVAIVGRDTLLVDAPGNVVAADDVVKAIVAFEKSSPEANLDPKDIIKRMQPFISKDDVARTDHNSRAEEAQARKALDRIVQTASID